MAAKSPFKQSFVEGHSETFAATYYKTYITHLNPYYVQCFWGNNFWNTIPICYNIHKYYWWKGKFYKSDWVTVQISSF